MDMRIVGLNTIPEVRARDDIARLIREAAAREDHTIDGDVLVVVAQKIVSKAEGAEVDLRSIVPSPLACSWATQWGKDARLIELVLRQSRRIVKMERGVLIAETRHGFVTANAGVDQSNVAGEERATILPENPDASACRIRQGLGCGAAIVSDTFGRPWREGLVNVAIGVSGMEALEDYRGRPDRHGRPLQSTILAVADELAAAAGMVMGKTAGVPVALIYGLDWVRGEGSARALIRAAERDLFR